LIPEGIVERGFLKAGPSLGAGGNKIFAGGDAVDQPRSIVTAIAAGKKGAISIDLHLRGLDAVKVFPRIRVGNRGSLSMETYLQGREERDWGEVKDVVPHDRINTLFFEPSQRIEMAKLPRKTALKGFTEVNSGFSLEEAGLSALRCFSCGTCNYCYNCYFFCPEGVISLDPLHQTKTVDLDHCKGCGTCAKSCPRNVVMMKEVG
jgi:ferredoxin